MRTTTVHKGLALFLPLAAAVSPVLTSPSYGATAHHAANGTSVTLDPGQTWQITGTTVLRKLVVPTGASVTAPDGKVVVMTVNGVEAGGVLDSTAGTATVIGPGTYRGNVVLHVVDANDVAWAGLTYPERQAVYVGADGVDRTKSVLDAVRGRVGDDTAVGTSVSSTGQNFTGYYVADRDYTIKGARIGESGNGRSDFAGYGAGIVADGSRLEVDDSQIQNTGAARVGLLAANGANVVVKRSRIHTEGTALPSDYQPTVDLAQMRSAPWMLGIAGTARATNITGENTKATYIGSDVSSNGWGVLSTDSGSNAQLTSINSYVHTTTNTGYGAYAIGNATDRFLGSQVDVGTYGAIVTGGSVEYGDTTPGAVSTLNESLDLGLSAAEIHKLGTRRTTVDSDGWGVMWHGQGTATVTGHTVINTKRSTFLDKGQQVAIDVDGSDGARLNPRNGVVLQMMQNDDPGPVMVDGKLVNAGVYTEPTSAPTKDSTFDVTTVHNTDAVADFTDIDLAGDFYNGMREGKNMALTFDGSTVRGVISSSVTKHNQSTITSADYRQLGVVSNTTGAVVNNGVIVDLTGHSTWTVAGTSYLSKLTIDSGSKVVAPKGKQVTMTVDGVATPIAAGTYTGNIALNVS
ncbi:hypothetical protein [Nocardioides sp. KR10-350]|uniref:hypothetical protein n=1 Tax=Nocardioides cheoyonin TaxID=3156615 RepID=UPI0032B383F8